MSRRQRRRRRLKRRGARTNFSRALNPGLFQRTLAHEPLEARRLLATDWELLGPEIDGVAAGDWSGNTTSLSADGRTLAIGAPYNDNGGSDAGHTLVYEYVNGDNKWQPLGTEIVGEPGDQSGNSVSISMDGQSVAIGAPLNNGVRGTDSGTVRVYDYNSSDTTWVQRGNDIDGEASGDRSGTSVSLSADGNTLAIGAPFNNNEEGVDAGHTRIHRYDSNSKTWKQIGQDLDGEAARDESGTMVSLSDDGNTVAIGAPKNKVGGFLTPGHVRVYQYNADTDQWIQLGGDIDGEGSFDMSGTAISLSGDGSTVAIGAVLNNVANTAPAAGHTRVFRYTVGAWKQLGDDIDGEKAGDASGSSVALTPNGNRIAIGAWGNDGANGENSGHVRVFDYRDSDNAWIPVGTDIDGAASGDESGSSVAFSDDGNTISIGAISNLGNGTNGGSGHTRVYHFADGNNSNTPPTLDAITGISIVEDASEQSITLTGISAGSGDVQPLRVTVTSNNTVLVAHPSVTYIDGQTTGILKLTPNNDQHGTATITVIVEDPGQDGSFNDSNDNGTVTRTFNVVVTPVNDPPVLATLPNITLAEEGEVHGTGTKLVDFVSDIDSDKNTIQYRITNLADIPASFNVSIGMDPNSHQFAARSDNTVHVHPATDFNGETTVTIEARDAEGDTSATESFTLTVTPVNDQPVITVLGEHNLALEGLHAGQYNDAGATAWDVEDGDLTNQVSVSGDVVNLGKRGAYTLRYNVEDSAELAAAQQIRTVTVVDTLPPIITLRLDNQVIHISDHSQIGAGGVTNTDPGQPQLTNNTSVGNATRLANPVYRDTRLKQPDDSDVRSRQDWTARAEADAVLDPELPTASAWDRLETPITVNATYQRIDLDGTACTENCTVAEVNFSQRSTYLLEYDAHDQAGNHAEQVVFALVLDDRIAPSITVAGGNAESVELGSDWILAEATAIDNIDGNLTANIRYEVDNVTAGTVLGTDLTYAAAANLVTTSVVADYMVTMTVSDNAGIYGENNTNNIAVAHKAVAVRHTVNVPPTLNEIPKQTVAEDSLEQTVNLGGITPGGIEVQPVRVTVASSKPDLIPDPEVTYNDGNATGTLKFKPLADQHGTATITVTIEDGGLDNNLDTPEGNGTFSRTFQVDVTPVNDLPIASDATYHPLDNTRLEKTRGAGLATLVTDVDQDPLTFSVISGPTNGTLVLNEDGSYHYTPDTNFNLTDAFQYRVSDGSTDSSAGTVTLEMDTKFPWHNFYSPLDVDGDKTIAAFDALLIINQLNISGGFELSTKRSEGITKPFLDVDHDGFAAARDALMVINYLNQAAGGSGEGEESEPPLVPYNGLLDTQATLARVAHPVIHQPPVIEQAATELTATSQDTTYWQTVDQLIGSLERRAHEEPSEEMEEAPWMPGIEGWPWPGANEPL